MQVINWWTFGEGNLWPPGDTLADQSNNRTSNMPLNKNLCYAGKSLPSKDQVIQITLLHRPFGWGKSPHDRRQWIIFSKMNYLDEENESSGWNILSIHKASGRSTFRLLWYFWNVCGLVINRNVLFSKRNLYIFICILMSNLNSIFASCPNCNSKYTEFIYFSINVFTVFCFYCNQM